MFWKFFFLSLLTSRLALAGFSVTPLIVDLKVGANSEGSGTIFITNHDDQEQSVDITVRDFLMLENGNELEGPQPQYKRGMAEWVSASPRGVVKLGPNERKEVQLQLKVPEQAKGSYQTKVFVQEVATPDRSALEPGKTRVQLILRQRWEVRLHETVPGTEMPMGTIEEFYLDENKNLVMRFQNSGNTLLHCLGSILIKDLEGRELHSLKPGNSGSFGIYPEVSRRLAVALPEEMQPGEYVALAIIDSEAEELMAAELEFQLE